MKKYDGSDYNRDIVRRDTLIFGAYEPDKYSGGIRFFDGMSKDTLSQLVEEGFADPEEHQNYAPTIGEFLEYDGIVYNGYVVSLERGDYRVSVEAVETDDDSQNPMVGLEFALAFRHADELDVEQWNGYAWWD